MNFQHILQRLNFKKDQIKSLEILNDANNLEIKTIEELIIKLRVKLNDIDIYIDDGISNSNSNSTLLGRLYKKIDCKKGSITKLQNQIKNNEEKINDIKKDIKICEDNYLLHLSTEIINIYDKNISHFIISTNLSELERAFQNYVSFHSRITVSNNVLHDNLEILKNMIISNAGIDGWANN